MPTLMPEDTQAIADAFRAAIEERAESDAGLEVLAKRASALKTVGGFVVLVIGLIVGVSTAIEELKAKPTKPEVDAAIEASVEPVRAKANEIEDVAEDVDAMREDLDRVEKIQDYGLEQSAWQGDVLLHVAERKRTKPPAKPESLKKKERELLRD